MNANRRNKSVYKFSADTAMTNDKGHMDDDSYHCFECQVFSSPVVVFKEENVFPVSQSS